MKSKGRFTINLKSEFLEENESKFLNELHTMGLIGYYYPHYFNENNIISSRGGLIVSTTKKNIIDRVKDVKNIYGIEPTLILTDGAEHHIIFDLDKGISESDFNRYEKVLCFLYGGKKIDYHFYNDGVIIKTEYTGELVLGLSGILSDIYLFSYEDTKVERDYSKHNLEQYNLANKIDLFLIAEKLGDNDTNLIDEELNFHAKKGFPMSYVSSFFESKIKTFEFFNNNFKLDFRVEENIGIISEEGLIITEGRGFYSDTTGYFTDGKDGEKVRITDFFIKVHYRLIKSDKEKVYIVSLVNETANETTEKLEWTNCTSKNQFSDFIQKLGNFHLLGGSNNIVVNIHKKISEAKVPDIKYLIGYGFHKKEGIVVFKNGIWDIKEKIFTPRVLNEKYYFNYNGKGYYPTDKQGNNILETLSDVLPSLNGKQFVELEDIFNFVRTIYSDDSGIFLIMMAFGMIGYSLFGDEKEEFPIFFVKGITASGKSTYIDILQKIWGCNKSNSDFSSSSLFTFTIMLSHLKKFPYFIGEYRESANDVKNKIAMLRSNFDKIGQTKGRPDQTIIRYDYSAIPIIDGEEMIYDPAVRTRSIQYQFVSKHKIDGNFKKLYKEGSGILNNLLYTYLSFANGEKYDEYKSDGFDIFKSTNKRISQNLASIYAGCMCFTTDYKDLYIKILNDVLELQNFDLLENSNSQQIVKAISKFLESNMCWDSVYDISSEKCVVISWNAIEDFIRLKKIDLTLKLDAYKGHLESIGLDIGWRDDKKEMKKRYGVIVPYDKIPQEFLLHSTFYQIKYNLTIF